MRIVKYLAVLSLVLLFCIGLIGCGLVGSSEDVRRAYMTDDNQHLVLTGDGKFEYTRPSVDILQMMGTYEEDDLSVVLYYSDGTEWMSFKKSGDNILQNEEMTYSFDSDNSTVDTSLVDATTAMGWSESVMNVVRDLPQWLFTWYSILRMVGLGLLFNKAGEKWWKAVIPFYAEYVMLKLVNKQGWLAAHIVSWIAKSILTSHETVLVLFAVFTVMSFLYDGIGIFLIVMAVLLLLAVGLGMAESVVRAVGIGKRMRLSGAMVAGLALCPPVFMILVGWNQQYKWLTNEEIETHTAFDIR